MSDDNSVRNETESHDEAVSWVNFFFKTKLFFDERGRRRDHLDKEVIEMAEATDPSSAYMPQIETLQGRDDWETWHQTMIINARISGFWSIIDGKEEKPDDETAAVAWEVKDLKAAGFLINALSMKIRIKLEDEGFDSDKMTSKQLLALIQTTILRVSQIDMFHIISDFYRSNRQAFTSLDAYVMSLIHNWTIIRANYPNIPNVWFAFSALSGLKESNETWYKNWTACLRQGKEINKDKLVKLLMPQTNK